MNEVIEIKDQGKSIVSPTNPRGAGRKPGTKNRLTILKEKKKVQMETSIAKMTDKLVNAQAIAALGTSRVVIVSIDGDGKKRLETVRDEKRIDKLLATGILGTDYIILAGADPDWKAANAMLDRAYGKAKDTLEVQGTFSLLQLGKKADQVEDQDDAIIADATEVENEMMP